MWGEAFMEDRISRIQASFDRMASVYDEMPFVRKRDMEQEIENLRRLIPDLSHRYVLDVGCGTGNLTIKLHDLGVRVLGIDFSDQMILEANRKKKGLFERMDFYTLDRKLEFDCAISIMGGAFGLSEADEDSNKKTGAFFEKLNEILNPGGLAVIEFLNLSNLLRCVTVDEVANGDFLYESSLVDLKEGYFEKAFTPSELSIHARNAGFEVMGFYGKGKDNALEKLSLDSEIGVLALTKMGMGIRGAEWQES